MPIYEYQCAECGGVASLLVRRSGSWSRPRCARCGRDAMRRLLSPITVKRRTSGRLERLTDPAVLASLDGADPAKLSRWFAEVDAELRTLPDAAIPDIGGEEADDAEGPVDDA